MGIWVIRSPLKIHCYTCMSCMSFKTCWSRLIYTKLFSHRSFVINMYVVTMAWRCISPWSFLTPEPQLNARKHWESESRNHNLSAAGRNSFWDHFLKELRHQAQLGNQAFWWFNNSTLTSPDWLKCDWRGTGKETFLLLAREKTNGKLSINPIYPMFL